MKRIALKGIFILLVLTLPQFVSTALANGGPYVFDLNWGSFGSGNGEFDNPRSVAVDSNGDVYVADTANHRIQKFDTIGNHLLTWGGSGSGNGQFRNPWGIAVDSNDNIYVADTDNHRIQKFDTHGKHLATFGSFGSGNGQFNRPRGVAVDSIGNIYVADTYNHRIQKLNSSGGFIVMWGGIGTSPGRFYFAGDVAVDSGGYVYVADSFNDRIQKFGANGDYLATLGSYGTGDDQLNTPWGVSVDSEDNLYVADTLNNRIKKYDSSGVFLGWWGYDLTETKWHDPLSGETGKTGVQDGQLYFPGDIAVDTEGTIFVADSFNDRIQKIDLVPPLGVRSPNGGEDLLANTTHDITWDTGVDNVSVRIDFSADNGTTWDEIVDETDNDGSYTWDIPCNLSETCLVRITGLDDYSFDESDAVFSIKSSTPPVITLIGLPELYLECGIDTYTEEGATAEDGCGNDVPVDIGGGDTVDTMTCGTYVVTYDATDTSGQKAAQKTRSVIFRDTSPPVPDRDALQPLSGECSVTITTFPTATDNCAGPITGTTTDPLSYNTRGTYTVTWTYDDGNGYTATQTQTVTVEDTTAPVPDVETLPAVTGECSAEITTHPTATDNCAGSITGTTTDPLSYTKKGTHTVTWTYDDGNGNTATQTQSVTVEDVTPPTVHLSDSTCVEVKKWVMENMLTVTASDNCTPDVEAVIDKVEIFNRGGQRVRGRGVYKIIGNSITVQPRGRDWSVRVTVTAADESGNTTTETITKPLLKCNRWSEKMARQIRLLYILMWKMGRCFR